VDGFLKALQAVLNAVNEPTIKAALGFVTGMVWTRWPNAQKKAIPFVNFIVSAALGAAQVLLALATATGLHTAVAAAEPSTWAKVLDAIVGTVVPVVVATGVHSGWKNTLEWISQGYMLFKKK